MRSGAVQADDPAGPLWPGPERVHSLSPVYQTVIKGSYNVVKELICTFRDMNVDLFMAARLGHAVVLQSAASTFPPLHGLVTAYFRITEKCSSPEPYLHRKGRDR